MARCQDLFERLAAEGRPVRPEFTSNFLFKQTERTIVCPDVDKIMARGEFYSPDFQYVSIHASGCNLGAQCRPEEDIYNYNLEPLFMNSYVDLNELDTTEMIKYETEAKYFMALDPLVSKTSDIFFMKSLIDLDDSIFKLFFGEETFTILEQINNYNYFRGIAPTTKRADKWYGSYYLRIDGNQRAYSRETYSMLEYLSDIGGIADILAILGTALCAPFLSKMLTGALIKSVYYI